MKRQGDALPAWMQAARQRGVFIQVVTVSGENAPAVKAGVMTGEAELHTLADKTRWMHREPGNTFVVAGVGGDSTPTTAERYTPESECRKREADDKTWEYMPGKLAWMAAEDVVRANQFDL